MAAPILSVDELLASADLSAYAQSFEEEGWDSLAHHNLPLCAGTAMLTLGALALLVDRERILAPTTRTRLRRLRQRRMRAPQSLLETDV